MNKGQLISKGLFGVIVWIKKQKTNERISKISALVQTKKLYFMILLNTLISLINVTSPCTKQKSPCTFIDFITKLSLFLQILISQSTFQICLGLDDN